jgi:hypothetical protein
VLETRGKSKHLVDYQGFRLAFPQPKFRNEIIKKCTTSKPRRVYRHI